MGRHRQPRHLPITRRVKRSTISTSASVAKPMLTQLRPIRHRDGSLPSWRSIERERSAEKVEQYVHARLQGRSHGIASFHWLVVAPR